MEPPRVSLELSRLRNTRSIDVSILRLIPLESSNISRATISYTFKVTLQKCRLVQSNSSHAAPCIVQSSREIFGIVALQQSQRFLLNF